MPRAGGIIKGGSTSAISAEFEIHNHKYHFTGTLSSDYVPFSCLNATIEYDSASMLNSSEIEFHGNLESFSMTITMDNGPKIHGRLDKPVSSTTAISGTGSWA
ncbi:hypothetical protein TWF694_009114 [Orbilia ellipsospora]|uniref:Uncharacterized protein n=1 Tax=Orbilia ellipsospora TaxID=2528407 RepID=A0AAV9XDX4_9PEZI